MRLKKIFSDTLGNSALSTIMVVLALGIISTPINGPVGILPAMAAEPAQLRAPGAAHPHILGNDHTQDANFSDLHNPGLFINETDTYLNKGTSPITISLDTFNFFAKKAGNPVTPVVVRIDGDNDFTVLAIGTTRSTYQVGQGNSFNFSDSPKSLTLQPGEKIGTGFIDADANGQGWGQGGNPIPAEGNGFIGTGPTATGLDQDEVWALLPDPLIHFDPSEPDYKPYDPNVDTPALAENQKILATNDGKELATYNLLRSYKYSIGLSSNEAFNGATLYTEEELEGTAVTFSDGISWLADTDIGSASASSIKVEDGYVAYLCDGTLDNPETCKVYPPAEFFVLSEWDNKATIIKVDQNDPGRHGLWESVYEIPQRAIAAAQMPDGRVMFWQGGIAEGPGKEISIIDPSTYTGLNDAESTGAPDNHDTFCPGPALTPNGDLVLAGGGLGTESASSVFYWDAYKWEREEDMNEPHYYGTSVMMANGEVFHALGSAVAANNYTDDQSNTPEVWNGTSWEQLTGMDLTPLHADHGYYNSNYYPFLHLMPNSNLFHSGGVPTMHEIDPVQETIHNQGIRAGNDAYRHWGNALMIDEGILFISGGRPDQAISNRTTVLIDINDELDIKSEYAADMNYDRAFHNMVQLPTGDVFVSGGNSSGKIFVDHGTVYPTELWDRETNTWTEMAELTTPRNYHSTSLLLPDGRIWQAGGDCGHCPNEGDFNHHFNLQIYSPPYLFNADGTEANRPVISSAPLGTDGIKASESFDVTMTGAGKDQIVDFNIIKMSSTTHQINTDVRRLSLDFTFNGSGNYTIDAHDNINVMTPGYWMLFAVNQNGVPSEAAIVHVSMQPGTVNPTPKPKPIKIIAGNSPAPLGGADSWASNLVINESDTYTNESDSEEELKIEQFEFYAGTVGGPVTPFIVTVNANDNFTIKAIGTTRTPSELGVNTEPFIDGAEIPVLKVQPGETVAVGFLDAFADGTSGPEEKAVVSRNLTSGSDEIYYVGAPSGKVASLTVGQAPELFDVPRDVGARDYAFSILLTKETNSRPIVSSIGNQQTNIGGSVDLAVEAIDADGDTLAYTAVGLPNGVIINQGNGLISGSANVAGIYEVIVTVLDGISKDSTERFTWTVVDSGSNNNIPSITNPGDQSNDPTQNVSLAITASDPDQDTLSYIAVNLPAGMSINGSTGAISGTPTTMGTYYVSVSVNDGNGAIAATSFIWEITEPPNTAPAITSPGNQTGEVGDSVNLTIAVSDVDNDSVTLSATGLPDGLSIDPSGKISGVLAQEGTFNVTVTADDGQSENSESEITFEWIVDPSSILVFTLGNGAEALDKRDDWKSNIVVNETDIFTNNFGKAVNVEIGTVEFYAAAANAPVTPFVVKVNADNDFTVLAIGNTRMASAVGGQSFPFIDSGTVSFTVQPDEVIAVGFIDANADGSSAGSSESVVTFDEGGSDEVWYVGQPSGQVAALSVGQAPQLFGATVRSLNRDYAFSIALVMENPNIVKPPVDLDNQIFLPVVTK